MAKRKSGYFRELSYPIIALLLAALVFVVVLVWFGLCVNYCQAPQTQSPVQAGPTQTQILQSLSAPAASTPATSGVTKSLTPHTGSPPSPPPDVVQSLTPSP